MGAIVTVILVAAVILTVVLFIRIKTSKRPSVFGYGIYTVISGSMVPTLQIGDVIIVKDVKKPEDLKKGDVITFYGKEGDLAGKIVTHRIVSDGVEDGKITTCGDANHGIADAPIEFQDVIGKYVRKSAIVTLAYSMFKSKSGFAAVVFIPLVILLVVQVMNFVKACKMDDKAPVEKEKTEEEIIKEREDEIRKKAIEEFLAYQKREAEQNRSSDPQDNKEKKRD